MRERKVRNEKEWNVKERNDETFTSMEDQEGSESEKKGEREK